MFTRKSARPQNRPRKARSVPWPVALAATVVVACTTVTPTGALWQVRAEAKATVQTGISAIRVRGEKPVLTDEEINDWLAENNDDGLMFDFSATLNRENSAVAVGILIDARQEGKRPMYYRVKGFSYSGLTTANAWLYRTPRDGACAVVTPEDPPSGWILLYGGPLANAETDWHEIVPTAYGVSDDVDANGRDKLCLNLRLPDGYGVVAGGTTIIIERTHIPSQ